MHSTTKFKQRQRQSKLQLTSQSKFSLPILQQLWEINIIIILSKSKSRHDGGLTIKKVNTGRELELTSIDQIIGAIEVNMSCEGDVGAVL